jgi:hypothetical protein
MKFKGDYHELAVTPNLESIVTYLAQVWKEFKISMTQFFNINLDLIWRELFVTKNLLKKLPPNWI